MSIDQVRSWRRCLSLTFIRLGTDGWSRIKSFSFTLVRRTGQVLLNLHEEDVWFLSNRTDESKNWYIVDVCLLSPFDSVSSLFFHDLLRQLILFYLPLLKKSFFTSRTCRLFQNVISKLPFIEFLFFSIVLYYRTSVSIVISVNKVFVNNSWMTHVTWYDSIYLPLSL